MAERILGPTKSRRRRRFLLAPVLLVVLFGLIAISSASGVLTGSPSKFESGNDPTLGLGNMIVNTAGNTDWISVTGDPNTTTITRYDYDLDGQLISTTGDVGGINFNTRQMFDAYGRVIHV